MSFFTQFARIFMAMRDCIVPTRSYEAQEEIVADLHSCLEQLHERLENMETRIQNSTHGILVHGKASQNKLLPIQERIRERSKAKQCLLDKKRIQVEFDKMQKNAFLIQNQIDAIVSSQLNMVVVDAMKQFSYNASKMALPARTLELEALEEHLGDRSREMTDFQEAISNASNAFQTSTVTDFKSDSELEADLMHELQTYFDDTPTPLTTTTITDIPNKTNSISENLNSISENLNSISENVNEQHQPNLQVKHTLNDFEPSCTETTNATEELENIPLNA